MWGPGAEQGGVLQTSTGKMELKEPYYRMSQPQVQTQAFAATQDQQSQQLMQPQVRNGTISSISLFALYTSESYTLWVMVCIMCFLCSMGLWEVSHLCFFIDELVYHAFSIL